VSEGERRCPMPIAEQRAGRAGECGAWPRAKGDAPGVRAWELELELIHTPTLCWTFWSLRVFLV
jgi:hypothetical protein